jgi:sodium borate transporter 11
MGGSNVKLADVIQGLEDEKYGSNVLDPTWIVVMATLPGIGKRKIAIARLKDQINFSPQAASVNFVILVVSSTDEKVTKSAVETGRTMATLFGDSDLRHELKYCMDEDLFRSILIKHAEGKSKPVKIVKELPEAMLSCGDHLRENIVRRIGYYVSDYTDGFSSFKTVNKVVATTVFLFFSIILPCVAFGALAHKNTDGKIDENRAVIGQIIGGILWAIFSGQPMLIIATTALVSLYSKVVYDMSIVLDADFYTVYAWVGIWNTVFVSLYAFFGVSNLIRFSTRSVEEIFTLFITTCFFVDAISDIVAG